MRNEFELKFWHVVPIRALADGEISKEELTEFVESDLED